MMKVAAMQPAFLPWQGFFELALASDIFVLLDDLQFSVQSYHQRNRLFINPGQPDWVTVPVQKKTAFGAPLNKAPINDAVDWRNKTWKRIKQNYSKAPYFSEHAPWLQEWLFGGQTTLAGLNIAFILRFLELLEAKTQVVFNSELGGTGVRSGLVADVVRRLRGDCYLSPAGAFDYMAKDGLFPVGDFNVLFQRFEPRPHAQVGSPKAFVPRLSALDALLNIGAEATAQLITGGTTRWFTWDEQKLLAGETRTHV